VTTRRMVRLMGLSLGDGVGENHSLDDGTNAIG